MDTPPESDETHGKNKISLENLSIEELVKKYRQALSIAQKAKESKAEFLKHISQHEDHIKNLEGKLQKCEDEKLKERDMRMKLQIDLQSTRELVTNMKNEHSSANKNFSPKVDLMIQPETASEDCHQENFVFLASELRAGKEIIKTQELELIEIKNKLKVENESKDFLKKVVLEKDKKIDKLLKEMQKRHDITEVCLTELKTLISLLENETDCKKAIQELQGLLQKQNEAVLAWNAGFEAMERNLDQKIEDNADLIFKAASKEEEVYMNTQIIHNLTTELQDTQEKLARTREMVTEGEKKYHELQCENKSVTEKLSCLESEKCKLNELVDEYHTKLHELKAQSEKCLSDKMEEIKLLQTTRKCAPSETQEELKEQIHALQETLSNREMMVQDLEQELFKLKDAFTNETTNTDVSSTFSFSRAEELSRMKDLEDSFEDKYTKLRVVAVKLKRRVTELTQSLENEQSKRASEKEELQIKLNQLASCVKTVQTLQSEVDSLQDQLEEQKKAQEHLTKLLKAAVKESETKTFELASTQENLLRITNEKESLETSMSQMESSLTGLNSLRNEISKLHENLKEKDIILETHREEKSKLVRQLEEIGTDTIKKSVLSLEMADLEKSVSKLTSELLSERDLLKQANQRFHAKCASFEALNAKFKEMEVEQSQRMNALKVIQDSLSKAEDERQKLQNICKEKESAVKQLSLQLEKQKSRVEDLNVQCAELAAKQVQVKQNARLQAEKLSRQVFQLEEECSQLKDFRRALEGELAAVRIEFENYKVRAQSVLRQSTKQEDRILPSSTGLNVDELELEVERLRVNNNTLKENLQQITSQLQAAQQEASVEREEKLHAVKQAQYSKESCIQAVEQQHAAEDRLTVAIEESKQVRLQSDMLVHCYKQQLEDLKLAHQKKIANMTEQMEALQTAVANSVPPLAERDHSLSVQRGLSPVADWPVQPPNPAKSDPDLGMGLSSLQREEGEGSESVDSFPTRHISVIAQDRRHELVPLDKLLSSPTYPEDDIRDSTLENSSDLSVDLLQSKLSACELRAAHLTALLSEAESDAARLSQLNAVLKEEIRRQQRCEERAQHAHNLEYLKNVVVKFVTLQNGDERQRLVPVLNTILKLSPDEAGLVEAAAKGTSQTNTSGGWGSYLPLPSWTSS